jgi:exodeoxyribonuclease VII small subunit
MEPELGFEAALDELEKRVRRLEAGDVSLEDALALYEEGMGLAQQCHAQLEAAEARVAALTRGTRGVEERRLSDVE